MKEIVWDRVGPKAVRQLSKFAEDREISMSEYIRQLILKDIEEKGGIHGK
jgi:hypothetical protein